MNRRNMTPGSVVSYRRRGRISSDARGVRRRWCSIPRVDRALPDLRSAAFCRLALVLTTTLELYEGWPESIGVGSPALLCLLGPALCAVAVGWRTWSACLLVTTTFFALDVLPLGLAWLLGLWLPLGRRYGVDALREHLAAHPEMGAASLRSVPPAPTDPLVNLAVVAFLGLALRDESGTLAIAVPAIALCIPGLLLGGLGQPLRWLSGRPVVVWYDSDCGVCHQTARVGARLDAFGRLEWRGNDAGEPPPGFTRERFVVERARTIVVSDGERSWTGHRAIARILAAVPGLRPLSWIVRLTPFAGAGYEAFSRNRHRISAWLGLGECGIGPPPSLDRGLTDAQRWWRVWRFRAGQLILAALGSAWLWYARPWQL